MWNVHASETPRPCDKRSLQTTQSFLPCLDPWHTHTNTVNWWFYGQRCNLEVLLSQVHSWQGRCNCEGLPVMFIIRCLAMRRGPKQALVWSGPVEVLQPNDAVLLRCFASTFFFGGGGGSSLLLSYQHVFCHCVGCRPQVAYLYEVLHKKQYFRRKIGSLRGSRGFQRFSAIFKRFSEVLSETLSEADFPLRGSQSCCPSCCPLNFLQNERSDPILFG